LMPSTPDQHPSMPLKQASTHLKIAFADKTRAIDLLTVNH
jgi:hypothetical protein